MSNWIVVPVRNGLQLTRAALKTFLAQDIGDISVLVIDNGSEDGTAQWLASQPVHSVHFRPGKSVAASWNFGLRWLFDPQHPHFSRKPRAEYALVVNNDVELLPCTYRLLVEDGGLLVTGVGVEDRAKVMAAKPNPTNKRPHPYLSCFLMRRECWQRVGPFDEGCKVAYCEDLLYHVKAHRRGVRAYCLDLPFYHHNSGTLKHATEAEAAAIRQQADRNREYFRSLHGCYPSTPEYDALFNERHFGVDTCSPA